ncbi:kinase-like domain-containing protein, partial [Ochromonadaceae sp. CCMP2298]
FDHILGKGGCGVVVLGKVRAASQEVAIKIVDKKNVDVGRLDREIKLLKDMDHSSVIRIFSVYDSSSLTYLVMEICDGGHLGNLISLEATKYVPEAKAKLLASQLVAAVAYIHSKGIAHRDIKLQNVLVERHAHDYVNLKLIDFGYAARFEGALPMRTKCGTPYTTAPEVIREEYDERCDVWSLGVVLFIMLSGRRPFELQRGKQGEDAARAVMITDILAGRFNFSQKAWKAVSAEGVAFVKELMQPNYKRRIRSAEVLAHPWLKSSIRTNLTKVITSGYSKNALNNLKKSTRQSALQKTGMMAVVFGIPATKTSRMLQLFQYFDTDRSGTISPFEFADAMTIVSPDLGQAEVTQLFDTLDYDCNGSISFTEFLAATLDPCEVDIAELNKAFELFDADGNGYIDRSEI